MLTKNMICEAGIDGWGHDGSGVARVEGRAVFVPGAIPGERWRLRLVKVTAGAVYARGEALLEPSPARIEPDCPAYPRCGGCALRHVDYAAELDMKLDRVNEAYRRIGGLALRADEILGAARTEGYRNKAIFAVTPELRPGFYRARSHDVIPVTRCRLQTDASCRAAEAVCAFARAKGFAAYDEAGGRGLLRHIFTRSARDGALQVTVVAAGGFGAATGALVEAVRAACPETVGVILNVNRTRGNTVLAGDFHTLWGADTLSDTLCGSRFALSPRSFYQVNPEQAERLYALAVAFAAGESACRGGSPEPPAGRAAEGGGPYSEISNGAKPSGLVLDLYCGAGTITLALARRAGRVIGAELVPAAVENAGENAARNGVENVEFLCADAGEAAAELLRRGEKPEAVVVDPPRKGLAPEVVDIIAAMGPERVVYVSCDVATQARDLKRFAALGYEAKKAVAVDMFPRTAHVETVALLSKLNVKQHIVVDLNMDELNLTAAESKATYQEIKDYVWEHHKLKVSSLYISQVKHKCGIIERECYNKPKTEGGKVPICPKDKEAAIMDALRHFQMIQ